MAIIPTINPHDQASMDRTQLAETTSIAAIVSLILFLLAFAIAFLAPASVVDVGMEVPALTGLGAVFGIFSLPDIWREKERRRRIVALVAGGLSLAFWLRVLWDIVAVFGEPTAWSVLAASLVYGVLFLGTRRLSRAARFDILLVYLFLHVASWVVMHHAVASGVHVDGGAGRPDGAIRFTLPWAASGQNRGASPCMDFVLSFAPMPLILATYEVSSFPQMSNDGQILCQAYVGSAGGYVFTGDSVKMFFDRTLWWG